MRERHVDLTDPACAPARFEDVLDGQWQPAPLDRPTNHERALALLGRRACDPRHESRDLVAALGKLACNLGRTRATPFRSGYQVPLVTRMSIYRSADSGVSSSVLDQLEPVSRSALPSCFAKRLHPPSPVYVARVLRAPRRRHPRTSPVRRRPRRRAPSLRVREGRWPQRAPAREVLVQLEREAAAGVVVLDVGDQPDVERRDVTGQLRIRLGPSQRTLRCERAAYERLGSGRRWVRSSSSVQSRRARATRFRTGRSRPWRGREVAGEAEDRSREVGGGRRDGDQTDPRAPVRSDDSPRRSATR